MKRIEISDELFALAETFARANACPVNEYVEGILLDVLDPEGSERREQEQVEALARRPWFAEAIEEGLASGDPRELTREMIHRLVDEGIESARARKK